MICKKYKHSDVAKEHRITPAYVSLLAQKALKNKHFVKELLSEESRREEPREKIAEAVREMNRKNEIIDSVAHIQKELKIGSGDPPRAHLVRSVLRKDLGMSYRKIVPIAWTANSHRNLILR